MTEQKRRPGRPKGSNPRPWVYKNRLQVMTSDEQQAWYEEEAVRRQITVGELIRTLIEQERTQ